MFCHITYIATGILTQVHAAMWAAMNGCIFQLWCRLGTIQLRVGLQSTIGAHQEK